jgi:hypothetical protein
VGGVFAGQVGRGAWRGEYVADVVARGHGAAAGEPAADQARVQTACVFTGSLCFILYINHERGKYFVNIRRIVVIRQVRTYRETWRSRCPPGPQ